MVHALLEDSCFDIAISFMKSIFWMSFFLCLNWNFTPWRFYLEAKLSVLPGIISPKIWIEFLKMLNWNYIYSQTCRNHFVKNLECKAKLTNVSLWVTFCWKSELFHLIVIRLIITNYQQTKKKTMSGLIKDCRKNWEKDWSRESKFKCQDAQLTPGYFCPANHGGNVEMPQCQLRAVQISIENHFFSISFARKPNFWNRKQFFEECHYARRILR